MTKQYIQQIKQNSLYKKISDIIASNSVFFRQQATLGVGKDVSWL